MLESVDRLPVEDQEILVELVQRRLVERRREEIAQSIAQAQIDCEAGNVFRGSVEDAIADLRS